MPGRYSTLSYSSCLDMYLTSAQLICAATVTIPTYLLYKSWSGLVWGFLWNVNLLRFLLVESYKLLNWKKKNGHSRI